MLSVKLVEPSGHEMIFEVKSVTAAPNLEPTLSANGHGRMDVTGFRDGEGDDCRCDWVCGIAFLPQMNTDERG